MDTCNASAKRVRLYCFLISILLSATLISEAVAYHRDPDLARAEASMQKKGKDKGKKKNKQETDARPSNASRAFRGGLFEASGVAYVPGTDGVLFVDDGRMDEIFWMRLDAEGNQVGAIKPVRLGLRIEDPEDITFDGSRFYIVGSQNRTQTDETNALVRFSFDPQSQSVKGIESVGGLFQFLTSMVPELKGYAGKKGQMGSINIEGLAWDPVQGRLLLGLRDPQVGEQSLVVPLKLRNPQAALSRQNLALAAPNAIRLALGGAGIRSIEYDERARAFQIISGAPEAKRRMDFRLWEWSGYAGQPPVEKLMLDPALKPEGITRVSVGGRSFLFVVCDASKYLKIG